MFTMPKKTTPEDDMNPIVSVRLTGHELPRFAQVYRRVAARNPYMSKSDVMKELAGITEPKNITEEDRRILRGEGSIPDGVSTDKSSRLSPSSKHSPAIRVPVYRAIDEKHVGTSTRRKGGK